MMLINLGYFKLLPVWAEMFSTYSSNLTLANLALIVVTVGITLITYRIQYNKIMLIEIWTVILVVVVSMVRLNSWAGITLALPYVFILLALPLYALLKRNYWPIDRMLRWIMVLTIGSYIFRAFISIMNSLNGSIIFQDIVAEGGETWIRNNTLRIAYPSFRLLIIPVAVYGWMTRDKHGWVLPLICIISTVMFTLCINQSRSTLISQIFTIVFMFICQKVNNRKKLIRYCGILILTVIIANSSWFNTLIDSFSVNNAITGNSTLYRLNAVLYYWKRYMQSPIFGIGIGETSYGDYYLSDIGFFGGLVKMGLPILFFYIICFGRAFKVYLKAKKVGDCKAILILGMTAQMILGGINIDCFARTTAFATPFYIAIVEYIHWTNSQYKTPIDQSNK